MDTGEVFDPATTAKLAIALLWTFIYIYFLLNNECRGFVRWPYPINSVDYS